MTGTMDIYPRPCEVAVVKAPAGSVIRAHCDGQTREHLCSPYAPVSTVAMIPGDRDLLGWGVGFHEAGTIAAVRNGHHRRDRAVWHEAAARVKDGGVVYVEHVQRDWYGKQVWQAVRTVQRDGPPVLTAVTTPEE